MVSKSFLVRFRDGFHGLIGVSAVIRQPRCLLRFGFAPGLALLVLAFAVRWWAGHAGGALPKHYSDVRSYDVTSQVHRTPFSSPVEYQGRAVRHDQAITSGVDYLIIQGDISWLMPSGEVIYEVFDRYGVDRRTRENLPGFGTQERTGQFLFPLGVQQTSYDLWDPYYGGSGRATFLGEETFRGLPVYLFSFRVDGLDETEGCSAVPDIPGKYRAVTSGRSWLRVEPYSGIVVHHSDMGVSNFVDSESLQPVGNPLHRWIASYSEETTRSQLEKAAAARRWQITWQTRLPALMFGIGLFLVVANLTMRRAS
jgi:hypothetical protein